MGPWSIGMERYRAPEPMDRLVEPAELAQHIAEVVDRHGEGRVEFDRTPVTRHCFQALVPLLEGHAEIEMPGRGIGLERRSHAERGNGRIEPILSGKRHAQVEMRRGGAWIQEKRAAEGSLRFGMLRELLQHDAEIVMGVGELRRERDGAPVARLGLRRTARAVERGAKMEVRCGEIVPSRHGPSISGDRVLGAAGVQVERAEIVQPLRVPGIDPMDGCHAHHTQFQSASTARRIISSLTSIYRWVVEMCLCPASIMMTVVGTPDSASLEMNHRRPE